MSASKYTRQIISTKSAGSILIVTLLEYFKPLCVVSVLIKETIRVCVPPVCESVSSSVTLDFKNH